MPAPRKAKVDENGAAVRPRCADLFCGAGGAAMGLYRAGFEVVGWDVLPQPHYPFEFQLGDAMEADLTGFDFVWASPPCQRYSRMQNIRKNAERHPDLVGPVRDKLAKWGGPWIVENVMTAPLVSPIMLCGTMFGLRIIKHRLFESNLALVAPTAKCDHRDVFDPWHGKGRTAAAHRESQGTPWIPSPGGASKKRGRSGDTNNAIPPAYSEFLGRQVLQHLYGRTA